VVTLAVRARLPGRNRSIIPLSKKFNEYQGSKIMAKNQANQNQGDRPAAAGNPMLAQDATQATTQSDANVGAEATQAAASNPVAPPVVVARVDPLLVWLADYQIKNIEPVQIKMMLRNCAEELGLDQAERIVKRFGVVRPNAAGVAKIGFEQVEALHRARAEEKRLAEENRRNVSESTGELVA
jgi:hypothetical protein